MRPRSLEEFVGQEHILGPGKLLRRAIEADRLPSVILSGPPGTGKTTLAHIIADMTRSEEHTSELQSRLHLVCRLLLEKKKKNTKTIDIKHQSETPLQHNPPQHSNDAMQRNPVTRQPAFEKQTQTSPRARPTRADPLPH